MRFLDNKAQQQQFNMDYGDLEKAQLVGQSPVRILYEKRLLNLAIDDIVTENMRCLDLGCGRGVFTQLLSKKFRNVIASDFAVEAVRTASSLLNQDEVRFLSSDGTALPFFNEIFDCVIIKDFIHHLDEPEKALSEINRVLRSGGILLSVEPNNRNFLGQIIGWTMEHERRYIFNSPKYLIRLMAHAGFRLRHQAFDGFYIPYGPLINIPCQMLPFLERFEKWMQSFFPTGAGHFIACYRKIK